MSQAKAAIARGESRTDWKRLRTMSDEDIVNAIRKDPELGAVDIVTARTGPRFLGPPVFGMPEPKVAVHIRLDPDIVRWFKSKGPRYQSRINAALRWYMDMMRFEEAAVEADTQPKRQAKKR